MVDTDQAVDLFIRRLLLRSNLNLHEQEAIRSLPRISVRVHARRDFVLPGATVDHVSLVVAGVAARFDLMRDGSRAIAQFFVAGDVCDLPSLVAPRAGWGLTALSQVQLVQIPLDALRRLVSAYPEIGAAFWRDSAADAGVLAKWVGNMGRKDAKARVAHLFCEMAVRIEATGLGTRERFALDITQEQIGDAMGLTPVHINRTLMALREDNLIFLHSHVVEVIDWERLVSFAGFDEVFLLLDQPENARMAT
ncbi:MAG: Crp/Fnr family transcriptional regulator [Zymomonas sp.]|nr:MAG: Crp/Fnr family transcriptional regulator [Zymomonas sp.]